jgi:hypothetical protein
VGISNAIKDEKGVKSVKKRKNRRLYPYPLDTKRKTWGECITTDPSRRPSLNESGVDKNNVAFLYLIPSGMV